MKFRRSRCTAVAALVVLLLIVVVCVVQPTGTQYMTSGDLAEFGRILFRPKKDTYNFNAWADALFEKYLALAGEADARFARFVVLRTAAREILAEPLTISGNMAADAEVLQVSVFDARLTLATVLAELLRQRAQGTALALTSFHWADWTDCSVYDQAMMSRDASCEKLRQAGLAQTAMQKDVIHDPYVYCFDTTAAGRQSKTAALQKVDIGPHAGNPGYHVFAYPGRSTQANMMSAGAAYLAEFMPLPAGVVILGAGSPVFVPSHAAPRRRLLPSEGVFSLAAERDRFATTTDKEARQGRSGDAIEGGDEATAPHEDASKLTSNSNVELSHTDFVDQSAQVVERLTHEELAGNLSYRDQQYLAALRMSLATEKPTKYFQEAKLVRRERNWSFGGHYDWRFFKGLRVGSDTHDPVLHGLLLAWLRFSRAQEIRTWLAHGTLLSWFWAGTQFPWDADVDVQMPLADLHELARKFNQTIVVDFGNAPEEELRMGRYFLDVGPWLLHRGPGSGQNSIDARFIDMDSGLYIDITALAVSDVPSPLRYGLHTEERMDKERLDVLKRETEGSEDSVVDKREKNPELTEAQKAEISLKTWRQNSQAHLYNCRNKHFSSLSELSPLIPTYMEGVPAYVPEHFLELLHTEYSSKSTAQERYRSFMFLPRLRLWVNARILSKYTRQAAERARQQLNQETKAKEQKEQLQVGLKEARANLFESLDMAEFLGNQLSEAQQKDRSLMKLTDEDYLRIMATEPNILKEYLVTRDYTSAHEKEMQLLLEDPGNAQAIRATHSEVPKASMRHDLSVFVRAKTGWRYEDAEAKLQELFKSSHGEEFKEKETKEEKKNEENTEKKKEVQVEEMKDEKKEDEQKTKVELQEAKEERKKEVQLKEAKELEREWQELSFDDVTALFQKLSEADARDPLITRPDPGNEHA